ncbi:fibronectin type III domain-containing protein [Actinoplanes friuliensis DSM 7358]|uniref:Fibronectin type III domain-containing protein n=1 Tax=Actinoplanes friuliensis DSM 7358 TaxID=1246995 RepID=U5VUP2_9ACTN|nr:fibronectin type III domain-containing protein [Actinoplanes friuliensis]AGZ40698.1 fibronectin type III domain-containing protein [Actinoplanes friuliensis DSM 7358]
MGTVLSLVAGLGLTVLGLGAADQAVASFDAASWVWSKTKGEAARINGVTARVDTRVDVPKARGHELQVVQNDRFVLLRDQQTGVVSSMDLTSLQTLVTTPTTAGIGVSVALHEDAAFVIDAVQGEVRQLDPRSLTPIGESLRFPPGITGGVFDGKGRLWIAAPSEGTVTAITAAPLPDSSATGGAGGGETAVGPVRMRTDPVAPASHDLTISTLENGVAILNRTTNALTTIRDDTKVVTALPLAGPGTLPTHTDGAVVPVTVPDARHVYAVRDSAPVADFAVPGDGAELQPAVAWEGFFYIADESTGTVHVFDAAGRAQKNIGFKTPGGPLELEVRENYLFINAPGSSTARVVDNAHRVRVVDKYADDVLGGDPPPTPPDPPPPPPKPKKPPVSKPGAPRSVRAAAGNAEVRVSWQAAAANGASITRYVVVGADKTFQVGANQRSLNVTGLTNGETYRFAVHAVNKKGDGPSRNSNAVKPTSEVPDAPTAATAEAKPDGTVSVSWPAANGQGLEITRYAVTAVSDGTSAPIGEAKGETSLSIKDGELEYGKQYAFTVVAINERGAGSKASPISNSVVPFAKPGRPENLDAATAGDQAGAIKVTWTAPPENGRAITKYLVAAGGKTTEVTDGTGATLTGFGTGKDVAVEVRAVNEAGESEAATASAQTLPKPVVAISGSSATFNTATVTFTVVTGGATATCKMTANNGGKSASGSCSSLKVTGLEPSTSYTFTVTATTAAGASEPKARDQKTDALYGTATCNNGEDGATATYCDKDREGRNGNEIFSVTEQDNDKQVGWAKPGRRLEAYCKKKGSEIDSYIYNHNKVSTWWVQVAYEGKNYIPFAWLNLDGGDDINDLPTC